MSGTNVVGNQLPPCDYQLQSDESVDELPPIVVGRLVGGGMLPERPPSFECATPAMF